ncbi:MAG: hypothetical protein IPH98_10660 [Saprospiraceae bacterium]|nr:hypothetical protein [Candidatus Defluviibacterium haderslevense]
MDFAQLKKWLNKMDSILEVYSSNEEFTQTEKNLLLDYLKRIEQQIQAIQVEDEETKPIAASPVLTNAVEYSPPISKIKKEVVSEPIQAPTPEVEKISHPRVSNGADQHLNESPAAHHAEYDHLFNHLIVTDLSAKLELMPLKNLTTGMGLNEKIVAQNELFNGDKSAFDKVIQDLNQLSDFTTAKAYLVEHVIPKYDWTHKDKKKSVESFLKLTWRRYL